MDAVTFQTEAMRQERLMYYLSYSMLSNNEDCADAVQETLARAWHKRNTLRDESKFKPWLMRILVNTCNDMLRKKQRQRQVPLEEDTASVDPPSSPVPLREAIDMLKPEWRAVIILHYLEGYSINDMAEVLGAPTGTIKSRMKHARAHLCVLLQEEWEGQV